MLTVTVGWYVLSTYKQGLYNIELLSGMQCDEMLLCDAEATSDS